MHAYRKVEGYEELLQAGRAERLAAEKHRIANEQHWEALRQLRIAERRVAEKRRVFRFRDLPAEIRNQIYRYCLIGKKPIRIHSEDERDYWINEIGGAKIRELDGFLHLTHSISGPPFPTRLMHTNLLCVNKKIHDEAATILYGCNRFTFLNFRFDIDFIHFIFRLRNASCCSLRKISINFPTYENLDVQGHVTSKFTRRSNTILMTFRCLPNLQSVVLRVYEDMGIHQLGLLRDIGSRFRESCKITLYFDKSPRPTWRRQNKRKPKVSAEVVGYMHDRKWVMKGSWVSKED